MYLHYISLLHKRGFFSLVYPSQQALSNANYLDHKPHNEDWIKVWRRLCKSILNTTNMKEGLADGEAAGCWAQVGYELTPCPRDLSGKNLALFLCHWVGSGWAADSNHWEESASEPSRVSPQGVLDKVCSLQTTNLCNFCDKRTGRAAWLSWCGTLSLKYSLPLDSIKILGSGFPSIPLFVFFRLPLLYSKYRHDIPPFSATCSSLKVSPWHN